MKRKEKHQRSAGGCSWETVRALAGPLPGTEEGTSYGTPAFKVGKKLFVRVHQDDADVLVVHIEPADRVMRLQADPGVFFLTDHYVNYPWVLVRMSEIGRADLAELLQDAWRLRAPKRFLDAQG